MTKKQLRDYLGTQRTKRIQELRKEHEKAIKLKIKEMYKDPVCGRYLSLIKHGTTEINNAIDKLIELELVDKYTRRSTSIDNRLFQYSTFRPEWSSKLLQGVVSDFEKQKREIESAYNKLDRFVVACSNSKQAKEAIEKELNIDLSFLEVQNLPAILEVPKVDVKLLGIKQKEK